VRSDGASARASGRVSAAVLACVAAVALASSGATAQMPTTSLGLGYPVSAVDARSAAMGGVGIGLLGGTFSDRNPADLTAFRVATLSFTGSPQRVSLQGFSSARTARSEIPVLGIVVPVGSWAFGVQASSFLDQDWAVRLQDTLSATAGDFPYTERREHNGGVSAVDFSVARSIGPLALGVTYGRLVGNLRESFTRRFEASVDSTALAPNPVSDNAQWSYSGWHVRAGGGLQIGNRIRVGGAYTWAGDLHATRDSVGTFRRFPLPDSWAVGASARPLGDLLLSVGGGWQGWSSADGSVTGIRARDVRWGGAGVEFSGLDVGSFPLFVRAGAHYRQLPFRRQGYRALNEKAVSFGLGIAFAGNRAVLDGSVEVGRRGDRSVTGTEERFERFVLTASLRQVPIPGLLP